MENDIQKLKIDYSVMSQKLDQMDKTNTRIEQKLDDYILEDKTWKKDFCEQMEHKFAQKWVEKVVVFIVGVTATAIVVAFMKLIIIN